MNGNTALRSNAIVAAVVCVLLCACQKQSTREVQRQSSAALPDRATPPQTEPPGATKVRIHNVLLRKGPILKVQISWLRGYMQPTRPNVPVSLDDVSSFNIEAQGGQVSATLDELGSIVNQAGIAGTGLSDLQFVNESGVLRLKARYRKLFPIQVDGDVSSAGTDRIRVHVSKIAFLKIPVSGLLHVFHLKTADLVDDKHAKGVQVTNDDIYIDLGQLLPPPHLRGVMTSVQVQGDQMVVTFGDGDSEVVKREQWRNYFRLRGGTVLFGKLQMTDADMIMIDTSADEWFDLDLDHYQQQMVYGYSRVTPEAGLQVFMPDVSVISHLKTHLDMEWVKHRDQPPPSDIVPRSR